MEALYRGWFVHRHDHFFLCAARSRHYRVGYIISNCVFFLFFCGRIVVISEHSVVYREGSLFSCGKRVIRPADIAVPQRLRVGNAFGF